MNNKEKQLLIFDYDGVIVDSIEIIRKVFNNLREKYGLPYFKSRDDIGKLLDKNFFETLTDFGFTTEQAQRLLHDIKEQKLSYESELHVFPNIPQLLKRLSPWYNCVIITSTHEQVVESFLKNHGLDIYFSLILGGNSEPSKVKKITTMLKDFSADKNQTYFISDTTGDIDEGKEVGVGTIGVTWGFHNKEKLEQASPDSLFDTVKELEEFLVNPNRISRHIS